MSTLLNAVFITNSARTDDEYAQYFQFDGENPFPIRILCSNPSYGDDEVYIGQSLENEVSQWPMIIPHVHSR
jgi:hypothetical protein